jgi:hypothetical protein
MVTFSRAGVRAVLVVAVARVMGVALVAWKQDGGGQHSG